ncbi:hypothetical protein ACQP2P_15290 [Dactylosporangium sp. CA-139114]|uniref:hypothetical protein n=1 Tax=Dactylosporangium sp. CA-139114 TaxID=3239931 RepID=UPI003D97938A
MQYTSGSTLRVLVHRLCGHGRGARSTDVGLLFGRLCLGVVFLAHVVNDVFDAGRIAGIV